MWFLHISEVRLGSCQRREHFHFQLFGWYSSMSEFPVETWDSLGGVTRGYQPLHSSVNGRISGRLSFIIQVPSAFWSACAVGDVCQLVKRAVGFCVAARVRFPFELEVGLGSFEEFTASSSHGVMA